MHNALKWIIRKQGSNLGGLCIVTWESDLHQLPEWKNSSEQICEQAKQDFKDIWDEEDENGVFYPPQVSVASEGSDFFEKRNFIKQILQTDTKIVICGKTCYALSHFTGAHGDWPLVRRSPHMRACLHVRHSNSEQLR